MSVWYNHSPLALLLSQASNTRRAASGWAHREVRRGAEGGARQPEAHIKVVHVRQGELRFGFEGHCDLERMRIR